ncbi:MAG TPA: serine hydrolase [Miltoncostaeaceae bacterium]|nr:serine hydrolase [Miltoncostaeaceae bacterium]
MRAAPLACLAAATAAVLAAAPPARAGDAAAGRALGAHLPAVEAVAARVDVTDPEGAQALYDAARDMEEALRRAAPVSAACRPRHAAGLAYARARVRQAEAMDRPVPRSAAPAARAARAAHARLAGAGGRCAGAGRGAPQAGTLAPGGGEATFGAVAAAGLPASARRARVLVDGAPVAAVPVRAGRARARLRVAPGHHDLRLEARDARGRVVVRLRADGVVMLPPSAGRAAGRVVTDAAAARRLHALATGAPGVVALWGQHLGSGRAAGAGADARFPAASTVKLGLLVAAARAGIERRGLGHDARQIARWSSNLATNRMLARLGGSRAGGAALAQATLARMGASRSTFPGGYIAGTALGTPPAVSARVTTARDLARVLSVLHGAAVGDPAARRATGLGPRAARTLIGMLAAAEQTGDNRSLVRAGLPAGTVVAEKKGWLRAAHHGAALVYAADGPRVVVVLTWAPGGAPLARARGLGAGTLEVTLGLR